MQAAVAAAVAAAANVGHQYPGIIRPMNVHSSKLSNANCSRLMNATSLCSNPVPRNASSIPNDIAPSIQLSRNFVMDYMWQQQHHSGKFPKAERDSLKNGMNFKYSVQC